MIRFWATVDTDIGIKKSTNQDACLIRHAGINETEVLLAVICDGIGGLSKGELASATVVRAFAKWFDEELTAGRHVPDVRQIGESWNRMLRSLNAKIRSYGEGIHISLGTTFTGILMVNGRYVIGHVGDSRAYYLGNSLQQLTMDQTFVAREIARGTMTPEQARTDPRRNVLLQCIGASQTVKPDILTGELMPGAYLLCSDGFRHVNAPDEIYGVLRPDLLTDRNEAGRRVRFLIEQAKGRNERDNISAMVIRTWQASGKV